ncbi:C45 family peptidase [Gimesia fumaroli]|uniref:Acyl-coenzyme A:6-aminopenicillanic acid acyl-transferase n=1 Tax=Gimesia fumaroli TaxID=2527976 RepID=A0A518I9P3_9PLAN|nr:peptidase C45 [Gimesia fumaroli]QDV49838.1 hypothetical protein Enr17x_18590 [Gimesia fumaroli]
MFDRKYCLVMIPALWIVVVLMSANSHLNACTTAVISGRATADGRPILWKNRDTKSGRHNEVVFMQKGKYKAVAVVNANNYKTVWMGVNEAGFCIENSLSRDLQDSEKSKGPGNGGLMKRALETCATVADFQALLDKTNASGRTTVANFGVIDAAGGAALFETGPKEYAFYDANDPKVAPHGYIVRSNFSMTANQLPANPDFKTIRKIYSSDRYCQACSRLISQESKGITIDYAVQNLTRDLSSINGTPFPGSINGAAKKLPAVIATDKTISRTTTVSAAVFHGVKPGEDPLLTTMWTILGDPKFSIAVPCWVATEEIADPLTDKNGGELGEIAILLREWNLNKNASGVITTHLPSIWNDLWPTEKQILKQTAQAMQTWNRDGLSKPQMKELHRELAELAMKSMQKELREMKQIALSMPAPKPPKFKPVTKTIVVP